MTKLEISFFAFKHKIATNMYLILLQFTKNPGTLLYNECMQGSLSSFSMFSLLNKRLEYN